MAPEVVVTETCKDDPYDYKVAFDMLTSEITLLFLEEFENVNIHAIISSSIHMLISFTNSDC